MLRNQVLGQGLRDCWRNHMLAGLGVRGRQVMRCEQADAWKELIGRSLACTELAKKAMRISMWLLQKNRCRGVGIRGDRLVRRSRQSYG